MTILREMQGHLLILIAGEGFLRQEQIEGWLEEAIKRLPTGLSLPDTRLHLIDSLSSYFYIESLTFEPLSASGELA